MIQPNAPENSYTLLLIETGLTLVAIAGAFVFPRMLGAGFRHIHNLFSRLARRKFVACLAVGASMLLLRVALLPLFPVPHPFQPDDFSFLLAADTFAHGRLTNPTPALWTHFETIHVTMLPSYMSMYFPGTGLIMAAGQALFGNPWVGILFASSAMCAAICWAIQGWLPPGWALLGGFLAVLRIGLFSCWTNTYMGGGSLAAVGGALVLGALPRLTRTGGMRYGMLMGLGIAILSISRPFEGLLVCLPIAFALGRWVWLGKNCPPVRVLLRRAAAPVALIAITLAWLGYYDYRAFGSPTTLPYTIDRATYAVAPYYVWQKAHAAPQYRHAEMRDFYTENEAHPFYVLHSPFGMLPYYMRKVSIVFMFFAGIALLPPVVMARRVAGDRRVRFLVWCIPVWIAGMAMGVYLMPHYLAPFSAAFYVLGLQGMRHLRVWRFNGAPVGRALVNATVGVCVLMGVIRVAAVPLHMDPPRRPISAWISSWVGPRDFGTERAAIVDRLERMPGQHLVFVRYAPGHDSVDEWVYNAADMDNSRTIWAQEMDAASDEQLMRHYGGRDVWLVQPDVENGTLSPYPMANQLATR